MNVPVSATRQLNLAKSASCMTPQTAAAFAHRRSASLVSFGAKKTVFVFASQLYALLMNILSLIKKTLRNADVLASLNIVQ